MADEIIQEIDYYDVSKKEWATVPEGWMTATSDLASFVLSDGKIVHVAGGYDQTYAAASDELLSFNAETMKFETKLRKKMDQCKA